MPKTLKIRGRLNQYWAGLAWDDGYAEIMGTTVLMTPQNMPSSESLLEIIKRYKTAGRLAAHAKLAKSRHRKAA